MMNLEFCGIILLMGLLAGMGLIARQQEVSTWNGGICKENGQKWELFDRDSQGGRGYRAGDRVCWISWDIDS